MSAKKIFEKLATDAMTYFNWKGPRHIQRNPGRPGEWIEKLSPEQREELQKLTPEDTQVYDRRLLYITGTYPENTITVHTHSVKKNESDNSGS